LLGSNKVCINDLQRCDVIDPFYFPSTSMGSKALQRVGKVGNIVVTSRMFNQSFDNLRVIIYQVFRFLFQLSFRYLLQSSSQYQHHGWSQTGSNIASTSPSCLFLDSKYLILYKQEFPSNK
jgi:hypothetical protein